jgi:polyhydroxyalkanoate synthase
MTMKPSTESDRRARKRDAAAQEPTTLQSPATPIADSIDRAAHALQAKRSLGVSPASLGLAATDWASHLATSPGKRLELGVHALRAMLAYAQYMGSAIAHQPGREDAPLAIHPVTKDRRFQTPGWQRFPYNLIQQAFLLQEDWWRAATTGVRGVSRHHQDVVAFAARQMLDMLAPSNSPLTNPEVVDTAVRTGGMSLLHGAQAWLEDMQRVATKTPPAGTENFIPGKQVAVTPGKVVLRNHLIELIQYSPSTPDVHAEPLLIIPAWIMKYYIMDLSPDNSMVKYLVDQGHTVFMVSWRNPDGADRDIGMDDYVEQGLFAALDAVRRIVPGRRVHGAGYCLGGTLLAIGAAALAARGDASLASVTLLASQTDFTEAGELSLFIDESQISMLEDVMQAQGYLDTTQMAGAFQMLRSYDLIWSHLTRAYMLGQQDTPNDLMAWNADATRMPCRMHSEYLRGMYLHNDLAEGRWQVEGRPVAVGDVKAPWFVVGTETDHVAPWRSVHKIHLLANSDVTFVLTSGGHNAGIVSEPGHAHRQFRLARHVHGSAYVAPDAWFAQNTPVEGSWWTAWSQWLAQQGSGERSAPPQPGGAAFEPLMDAPGTYVLQR